MGNNYARRLLLASGVTKVPVIRRTLFRLYYTCNSWGDAESRSGAGSNLTQTEVIRRELPDLFRRWGIRSLLDVPCGDGHWWVEVDHDLASYTGADIVPEMIEKRQANARPGESFKCLDVTSDLLPQVDAIFCRDLLVHLSFELVERAIANFKRSGAEYLITTTFPGRSNVDIKTGKWRPLDLTTAPFNFPAPLELLNEDCTEAGGIYTDKSLGVWRLADLPTRPVESGKRRT
jgi:SAM-dependent methyltransferase